MSTTRVELRPHVLRPDYFTVSVYRDNILVYTQVQSKDLAENLAEDLSQKGCSVCWNKGSGAPYRDWHRSHQAVKRYASNLESSAGWDVEQSNISVYGF